MHSFSEGSFSTPHLMNYVYTTLIYFCKNKQLLLLQYKLAVLTLACVELSLLKPLTLLGLQPQVIFTDTLT